VAVICRPSDRYYGTNTLYGPTATQQCKNLYYTSPIITIVTIFIIFIYVASTLPRNPGHLASRGWFCRDAGQHGTNQGHPGKSGTCGNPTWSPKEQMARSRPNCFPADLWRRAVLRGHGARTTRRSSPSTILNFIHQHMW